MTAPVRFPRFFVTSPAPCPYLPGRSERKVFTELKGPHADELNDALAVATVIGWSFDEPFSKDALQKLLNEYKGLGTVVAKHFNDSRKSLAEK